MHGVTDETEACARRAIRVLNEALEADRAAVSWMFGHSFGCNEALANHPTIQATTYQGPRDTRDGIVRVLGIINGLFGILADGYGLIAAEWELGTDGDTKRIVRFVCTLDTGHSR